MAVDNAWPPPPFNVQYKPAHGTVPLRVMTVICFTAALQFSPVQGLRFGCDAEACLKAIQIGFELSPRPSDAAYQGAVKTLEMVPYSAILQD